MAVTVDGGDPNAPAMLLGGNVETVLASPR